MTDTQEPGRGTLTAEAAATALESIRTMLAADGYSLDVAVDGGRIELSVTAGPDACAECLVPKELFGTIVADVLAKGGIDAEPAAVSLRYPADLGA